MKVRTGALLALVTLVAFAIGSLALAAYPERPVKLIIPWAVGGDTDATRHPIAEIAKKYFDQSLIVVNITGASGTVGAREVIAEGGFARLRGEIENVPSENPRTAKLTYLSTIAYLRDLGAALRVGT